jgi:hypothetical protein
VDDLAALAHACERMLEGLFIDRMEENEEIFDRRDADRFEVQDSARATMKFSRSF